MISAIKSVSLTFLTFIKRGSIYSWKYLYWKSKNIAENIRAAFIEIENGIICYYSLEEKAEPFFVNQKKNNRVCIGDELLVQVCRERLRQTPLRNL